MESDQENAEKTLQVPKPPRPPLNPHDAKTVAKQLCYRIPESKDSLYFILRGLGLPLTGESLGSTPRVEVDSKEYPTLWRALDCLGVPHDGKVMIIKAESPSLDALCERKGVPRGRPTSATRRGSRTTVEPPAAKPDSKATALPVKEPEVARSTPSSRPLSAQHASGYPRPSLEQAPLRDPPKQAWPTAVPLHPVGPTRLFHSASEPKLSAARAKDLLSRITKPLGDLGDLKDISAEVVERALRRPASAPMSSEEQRRRCEALAQPKALPNRFRQRCKFRQCFPASMVAAQRASVQRLSRPKSAKHGHAFADEMEMQERLELWTPQEGAGEVDPRPGAWMLQAMKQNAEKQRGDNVQNQRCSILRDTEEAR